MPDLETIDTATITWRPGVFNIYTDANGSDKTTGLFIPASGRLVSGSEYDNHGDTENYFRYSYTSGPYKGEQISLVHVVALTGEKLFDVLAG